MQVENHMVRDLPEEPLVVGECAGCGEDIYLGDEVYDFGDGLTHQDSECCQQYVSNISICRTAGE